MNSLSALRSGSCIVISLWIISYLLRRTAIEPLERVEIPALVFAYRRFSSFVPSSRTYAGTIGCQCLPLSSLVLLHASDTTYHEIKVERHL